MSEAAPIAEEAPESGSGTAIERRGYRHWSGELRGRGLRWFTITRWGVKQTWQSKWLKRLVLAAWLPLLYFVLIFFAVGQITDVSTIEAVEGNWQFALLRAQFGGPLADAFIEDPAAFRPMIWATTIYFYLFGTHVWVMLVSAVVGPKLISQDLASQSLALYFSKPLTRIDYVFGKLGVVSFWIGTVTLAPVTVLYVLSILFSPTTEALTQTLTIMPRIVGVSLVLMVGAGAPILALSSLTKNARFLGFLWAGAWVLSQVASQILSVTIFKLGQAPGDDWTGLISVFRNFLSIIFRFLDMERLLTPAAQLSPRVARWLDNYSYEHDWRISLFLVAACAVVSLMVVAARVGRPGEAGSK